MRYLIVVVLAFLLGMSAPTSSIDPLWDNTVGGNQGINAFIATGDRWDLVAANFLDGGQSYSYGRQVHHNSYQNGPWLISFTDFGTAHYKSWPDVIFGIDRATWHSRIVPISEAIVDLYIYQYPSYVTFDDAIAGVRNELAALGVTNPFISRYSNYVTGTGTTADGENEYVKFFVLHSLGSSYAAMLVTDNMNAYQSVGNSINIVRS